MHKNSLKFIYNVYGQNNMKIFIENINIFAEINLQYLTDYVVYCGCFPTITKLLMRFCTF